MNYFITQDWSSTHGNHAGMTHLCNLIQSKHKEDVKHIVVPDLNRNHTRPIYHIMYIFVALRLCFKVKKGDRVFLMEYLDPARRQDYIARLLKIFSNVHIVGLVHFVPEDLDHFFSNDATLHEWCSKVDAVMTLGSSLSDYLVKRGVLCPVKTAFHYVDLEYYQPKNRIEDGQLKAVFMGKMKRDFQSLEKIVKECPGIQFVFLKGGSKVDTSSLEKYKNIQIYGYLSEEELREVMNTCNISLNLMFDTIGSNVITTSLAMGMAMLVSDVGSIRDYCDDTNSVFCNNVNDFVIALNGLSLDIVKSMGANAIVAAKQLAPEEFYKLIISF